MLTLFEHEEWRKEQKKDQGVDSSPDLKNEPNNCSSISVLEPEIDSDEQNNVGLRDQSNPEERWRQGRPSLKWVN